MSYLGLPLSLQKLSLSDLRPTIAKADKYLAGWQASMLSHAERIILVNAVLDSLPVYAMSATKFPKNAIEAIDKRTRSFLVDLEMTLAQGLAASSPGNKCAAQNNKGRWESETSKLKTMLSSQDGCTISSWATWLWHEVGHSSAENLDILGPLEYNEKTCSQLFH
uniref:Uncharacterized protein n=1 Tax=Oryza alta TaxID=52545 RepID=A0A1V1H7S7_9ORYZ|nr:hypothetical protein [Oryza alta]